MSDFIIFCNNNQGFVSAILAAMSLLFSVIAIIVSIKVSKMPFRKKVAVAYYTNFNVGGLDDIQYFSIEATNIGNRVVKIKYVGIGYKKRFKWKKAYNIDNPNPSNVMLGINETVEAIYEMNQLNYVNSKTKYAIAIDIEGKIYKRKIK